MTLNLKEVEHIALLARLELSGEEKRHYQQQLSHILDHIAQLQKLDTSTIDASAGMHSKGMRLHADEVRFGLTTSQALDNAPDVKDDQFRVPPVME
jgi:aspartyl-tRNA(Asn)/glutamyl-tRNA(Gln) amidotransferase subunit C